MEWENIAVRVHGVKPSLDSSSLHRLLGLNVRSVIHSRAGGWNS